MALGNTGIRREEVDKVVLAAARNGDFSTRAKTRSDVRHGVNKCVNMGFKLPGSLQFVKERELWAINVSKSSIAFLSDTKLTLHSTAWLDLRDIGGPNAIVEVRVRSCTHLAGCIYRGVADFLDTPATAESSDIFSA